METLQKSLEHAPALAAIIIVVFAFLRRTDDFIKVMRDLNAENMEARQHSRQVIEKCTEEMTRCADSQARCAAATEDMIQVVREIRRDPPR